MRTPTGRATATTQKAAWQGGQQQQVSASCSLRVSFHRAQRGPTGIKTIGRLPPPAVPLRPRRLPTSTLPLRVLLLGILIVDLATTILGFPSLVVAARATRIIISRSSSSSAAFLLNTKPLAFIRPSTTITMPPKRKASTRAVTAPGAASAASSSSSSSPSPSKSNKKAKASAPTTFSSSSSSTKKAKAPTAGSTSASAASNKKPKATTTAARKTTTPTATAKKKKAAPKNKNPQPPPPSSEAAAAAAAAASSSLKYESNDDPLNSSSTTSSSSSPSSASSSGLRYFLMKSEPHEFSVDDLAAQPGQTHDWSGVRNYQARNLMRDQMRVGDKAFFYHSSCKVPGIVGLVEISKKAYPDHFQWDKKSKYSDEKSTKEAPRWWMVDVTLKEKLEEMVPLEGLREEGLKKGSPLAAMALLQKGSRLSVQPVREEEWQFICERMIKKEGKKEGGGVKKEEGKGAGEE